MLDRRDDGSSCRARAGRWPLRRPTGCGLFREPGARRRRCGAERLRRWATPDVQRSPGERWPAAGCELRGARVGACVARRRSDARRSMRSVLSWSVTLRAAVDDQAQGVPAQPMGPGVPPHGYAGSRDPGRTRAPRPTGTQAADTNCRTFQDSRQEARPVRGATSRLHTVSGYPPADRAAGGPEASPGQAPVCPPVGSGFGARPLMNAQP
jgi:hypothetical protein